MPSILVAIMALLSIAALCPSTGFGEDAASHPKPATFADLLKLDGPQLAQCDLAWTNLLCAQGLPFADEAHPTNCIYRLEYWADKVRTATAASFPRFQRNPAEFENSEPFFRMLVLITVLQKDCGVSYNPARIAAPTRDDLGKGDFFADSRDLFLQGVLGARRTGTCASLPVLYVAVGRRLGYPLKLVEAKSHLFARWEGDDGKTKLNIEAAGRGLICHADEHYKQWPFAISDEEIQSGQYLKSLEPAEELAMFLMTRACCLMSHGKTEEALAALSAARRLAPHIRRYAMENTPLPPTLPNPANNP